MADSNEAATVHVPLGTRAYDVVIGRGVLGGLGRVVGERCAAAKRAFVVVDDHLPVELVARATESLAAAGLSIATMRIHASEAEKSLGTLEQILVRLAETRHERTDVLIALGGGVVGDVAGFAAGVYRRGTPFIQCPTTLLSMVDASVGGKTAVNLRSGSGASLKKNLVGAFHQPVAVLADLGALDSLPRRELAAGFAECVKHGLISTDFGDGDLWSWMEANAAALLGRRDDLLTEFVRRNVQIKARVVASDEREEAADEVGGRALLNLGHTFGHAIEPIPGLSPDGDPRHAPLLHGEAVALGLVAASATAEHLKLAPTGTRQRVETMLTKFGLPVRLAGLPDDATIMTAMAHDKKVTGGRMRLVLPCGTGRAKIVADPAEAAVRAGLDAIRMR